MGEIRHLNVEEIIDKVSYFVETGTGNPPLGLLYMMNFYDDIKRFYSMDIIEDIYNSAKEMFKEKDKVSVLYGNSELLLPIILKEIPENECILFWLDAHLAGYHTPNVPWQSQNINLPLETELKIIKEHHPNNCYIYMDDLRIYEDGPYGAGNWRQRKEFSINRGIDFMYELFSESHKFERSYDDQGYMLLKPIGEIC